VRKEGESISIVVTPSDRGEGVSQSVVKTVRKSNLSVGESDSHPMLNEGVMESQTVRQSGRSRRVISEGVSQSVSEGRRTNSPGGVRQEIREGVSQSVSEGRRTNSPGGVRQEIREGVSQSVSEGRRTNSEGGAMQLLSCIRGRKSRYESVALSVSRSVS
jgi:hypothetical protein